VAGRLVQAIAVERTETALVVGAGAGYEAALLGLLARTVYALEADAELARSARAALVDHRMALVKIVEGPLREGWREGSPYDAILFAGAVGEVPQSILAQLAEGGRLAAVVRTEGSVGRATLTTRTGGVIARRVIFDAATPLLPDLLPQPAFEF
jgi:protein-L-isoaspartate(D-aspartate) O-methyltransferase